MYKIVQLRYKCTPPRSPPRCCGMKAEVLLNNFFSSVFTREDLTNMPDPEPRYIQKPLMWADILVSEVNKELTKMNCDKSSGPDQVHPKVLKMCADSLAVPLTKLFTKSLETGKEAN